MKKVLELLAKDTICSLTTTLKDGSPHASTLHFSFKGNPLEMYFSTDKTSKKCEGLLGTPSVKASFLLGFTDDMPTLQMDGDVEIITDKEKIKEVENIHYKRNPNSAEWKDDPNTVLLMFKPTWWRYTEYIPEYLVISSEDVKNS